MKNILNLYTTKVKTLLLINFILLCVLIFSIININIIPIKWTILSIIIIILLYVLIAFLIKKNSKKKLKIISYIINVIFIIISLFGIYFLNTTDNYLKRIFLEKNNKYTSTYYVLTNNVNLNDINDFNDKIINYYINTPNIDNAINKLKEVINFGELSVSDIDKLFTKDNILIEKNLYDSLKDYLNIDFDNYKIVYSFNITVEEEVNKKIKSGNYLNIYIGGPDFTNTNYDFNMIVTINKDTKKILLTSTPRDYYVTISGKGMKDILGYAGVWGINTSIATLENLYDIDINNYVKIDTSSLVKLVDVLDGVEFCSELSFTTNHSKVLNTYDDTLGEKMHVEKGCKTYNGIEILTIARERKAFSTGDRQRQKNCQQIMINIFNKIISYNSIVKFNEILDATSDLYSTNLDLNIAKDIVKNYIDGNSWTFETQSVTGSDSSGKVHLNTVKDYVMLPIQSSLTKAINKIHSTMYGE